MNISLILPMVGALAMGAFAIFYGVFKKNQRKPEAVIVALFGFALFLIDLVYNFNHQ